MALPAWLLSRAVVLATLALAHRLVDQLHPTDPSAALRVHEGLLAWDGGWYQTIARFGYEGGGLQSLRFFPVFPILGRAVATATGIGDGTALVLVANASALVGLAVLAYVAEMETGDRELARRTVWILVLSPAAYTLVMGYAEGTFLVCTTVGILAARKRRWWLAAGAGLAAGGVRPLGLLLAIPFAIEAARSFPSARTWPLVSRLSSWPGSQPGSQPGSAGPDCTPQADSSDGAPPPERAAARSLVASLFAVASPLVGTAAYLAFVGVRFGHPLLPFQEQTQGGHRGPITAPFTAMVHNAEAVLHGHHVGSALHIPWVLLCVMLLFVAARRLPASYTAFAAAIIVVSAASTNLDSFERYAMSAFPLALAAGSVTSRPEVSRFVVVALTASLVGYGLLAFLGIVVP